jgi:hypothetical protein
MSKPPRQKAAKEPWDFEELRHLPGDRGRIMRAALGATADDLEWCILADIQKQQAKKTNVFLTKYRPGQKKKP